MNASTLDRDRLSVLTGAILLALSMSKLLEAPVRSLQFDLLGSQVGFDLSATTIMQLIVLGLGITAAESLVRSHPLARQGLLNRSGMYWIVPGLLLLGLATWLISVQEIGLWTAGLLISSVLIPISLASEYVAVDREDEGHSILRWAQMVLVHLLAFILYAAIFDYHGRSLLSGSAVLVITTLLAARLFWPIVDRSTEALIYGLTAGVLLGLMTWVLNYWRLSTLQGGLILLVLFYVTAGIIQQHLYGRLNRRIVLEYGGVGVLALLAIIIAA